MFEEFEKGQITDRQFIDELKKHAPVNTTDEQIERAWNAMLLDYPPGRTEFLKTVGSRTNVFVEQYQCDSLQGGATNLYGYIWRRVAG